MIGSFLEISQKTGDDALSLSRRGFHIEPGTREKAVSISNLVI